MESRRPEQDVDEDAPGRGGAVGESQLGCTSGADRGRSCFTDHERDDGALLPEPVHAHGRHGARVQPVRRVPHGLGQHALGALRARARDARVAHRARDRDRARRQGRAHGRDVRDQGAGGDLHPDARRRRVRGAHHGHRRAVGAVALAGRGGVRGVRGQPGLRDPGAVRDGGRGGGAVGRDADDGVVGGDHVRADGHADLRGAGDAVGAGGEDGGGRAGAQGDLRLGDRVRSLCAC